jgi:hypothetical protein
MESLSEGYKQHPFLIDVLGNAFLYFTYAAGAMGHVLHKYGMVDWSNNERNEKIRDLEANTSK